ncbi:hypothetical protein [Hungatella hathewayi]|uniref:hypothetical protein n=1 Tax=Hungatella hathewayi TaxID=154046 RepID=UPI003565F3B7
MTRLQFIKHLIRCKAIRFHIVEDGPLKSMIIVSSHYFLNNVASIGLQLSIPYNHIDKGGTDKTLDIISSLIDCNIEKAILTLIFDIRNTDPGKYEPYRIYNKKDRCYLKDKQGNVETFIEEEDAYDYLIKDINFRRLYKRYKIEVDINTKVRRVQNDFLIDITEETKEIFNNDIKRIEVSFLYDYDDISEEELQEEIITGACDVLNDLFLRPSCVDFGGETLYITFHSGNQVKITNSEWADISKV